MTDPPAEADLPSLTELRWATWRQVAVRAVDAFRHDNGLGLAASLAYWSLLALFPAAIVVVALVGLVATGDAARATIAGLIDELAPPQAAATVRDRLAEVTGHTSTGVLLSAGVLALLWSASAYVRSFTRAANAVYGVPEGRPFYRLLPQQLGLTVAGLVLVAAVVAGLVVSGPVARAVGGALGVEQTTVRTWGVAKWPVLVLIAVVLLALLFRLAPNVRQPGLRWQLVGAGVALVLAVAASTGFGFFVSRFGSYDATYGTLGAVIVFLVWLFLVNAAVLFGLEVNAELARARRTQVGLSGDGPPLPPRVAPRPLRLPWSTR